MIQIKFKVFASFSDNGASLKGEYGYFQFCIDDKVYGEYREDIELDILSMDIYEWFSNFIKATIFIKKNKDKVYINDVDTPEVWIKMVTNGTRVEISEIYADKPDGSRSIVRNRNLKEQTKIWERSIEIANLEQELALKTEQYLLELRKLNNKNNEYIKKLKLLLREMKSETNF